MHPLPWFGTVEGYALVPPEGALTADEDPAAIIVLTEGGQLMVHDLKTFTPVPLNLPFQVGRHGCWSACSALPCMDHVKAACLVTIQRGLCPRDDQHAWSFPCVLLPQLTCTSTLSRRSSERMQVIAACLLQTTTVLFYRAESTQHCLPDSSLDVMQEVDPVRVSRLCSSAQQADDGSGPPPGPHAVTLHGLRALRAAQPGAHTSTWKWRFVFSGGSPPAALEAAAESGSRSGFPGDLLYTGHRDGRVRVWDASSEVPVLLAMVPFDAGGQTGRLRGVTAVDVCTVSGLLAVAHDKGDVRVYQLSVERHEVSQAVLTAGSGRPSFQVASQPAGYQCVAHVTVHDADVTALALASRCPLLAAGDVRGCVSIIDLAQPAVLHRLTVCPTPVAALGIGAYVVPPPPPAKRSKDVPNSPTEAAPDVRCKAATYFSA